MDKIITSFGNKTLKEIRLLQSAKGREESGLFVAEGERFVAEAILCGADIRIVVLSESFAAHPLKSVFLDRVREEAGKRDFDIIVTSDDLFESLCDTETPQGVLAVAAAQVHPVGWAELAGCERVLVLDRIRDPGNLGTIIRSADAFAFGAVILMKGCVDVYNPKVLRATMGSIFRVRLISADDPEICLAQLKDSKYITVAADAEGEIASFPSENGAEDLKAIVIGSEADGVAEAFLKGCDRRVRIAMPGKAESLNAGVAASILMYEESKRGHGI